MPINGWGWDQRATPATSDEIVGPHIAHIIYIRLIALALIVACLRAIFRSIGCQCHTCYGMLSKK